jgi:hypothetical protein
MRRDPIPGVMLEGKAEGGFALELRDTKNGRRVHRNSD